MKTPTETDLLLYHSNELSPERRKEVQAYLETSAEARDLLSSLSQWQDALSEDLPAPSSQILESAFQPARSRIPFREILALAACITLVAVFVTVSLTPRDPLHSLDDPLPRLREIHKRIQAPTLSLPRVSPKDSLRPTPNRTLTQLKSISLRIKKLKQQIES